MNTANPLKPQGSQFEQAASQARNRFKLAVYVSLAVCAVSLAVLLAVGCKKEEPMPPPLPPANDFGTAPAPAPTDSNVPPVAGAVPLPPPGDTLTSGNPLPPLGATTPPPPPPIHEIAPPPAPVQPTGNREHVVEQGESFYSIGKKLGVSWKAIEKANPTVNPSKLKKGDKILIPESTTPAPGATTAAPAAVADSAASGGTVHKVVGGDNLSKIGKKYGVTPKAIMSANNLKTTRIKVGDKLTIPAKAAPAEAAPAVPPPAPTTTPPPSATTLPPLGTPPPPPPATPGSGRP